ncbi:MAG: AAA family ATPase [Anaerolineales bacterium]|nr:AAA family ATPase [Anaerolineales bacterium]MDW8162911.1 ATP-binding protein [Anaerolineales bacterium]
MIEELPVEKLYHRCDPAAIPVSSSISSGRLKAIIGQERAVKAMRFGLGIQSKGFNLYVCGWPGTGRTTAIKQFLEEIASTQPTPPDWCYVNNFSDPSRPNAILLPPGMAVEFQRDMDRLVREVVKEVRSAFESEQYAALREETLRSFQQQKQTLLENVHQFARQEGFVIQPTPVGLLTIPLLNGKPLEESEFLSLPEEQKEAILARQKRVQEALEAALRQARSADRAAAEALQQLDQRVASFAMQRMIEEIKEKYQQVAEVSEFIDQVQKDMLENLALLRGEVEEEEPGPKPVRRVRQTPLRKYSVNVLVDNSGLKGAPVVVEMNPTLPNLLGKIEQEAQFGTLVTDFTLIRQGALHRANGGYLVLPFQPLLANPFAWDSLKRALENEEIVIEEIGERIGFATRSLRPEPIPLKVKVILIGTPYLFLLAQALDDQFAELFKVKADFDTVMDRNEQRIEEYLAFVGTLCENEGLLHLDREALARFVEIGSRLAADQRKLSVRFRELSDILREANYYAHQEGATQIQVNHLEKALEEQRLRSNLVQERIYEMIRRGALKIDVSGWEVGQVNGLSVVSLGDYSFGQPNRITASIGLGREGVIDIEREAKLGGPIHTKGVLILSGYLSEKFAQDKPLTLSARLVFEQSYSGVEGDSASSAELYALLSALAEVPLRQGVAVTGSVNQKGEIQAVGGVNEKIEGFFDVCQALGLDGEQGVIIPASNVENLMLKESVRRAVEEGKFHIWAVNTVEEGIEILSGLPAGKRNEDGRFEENTVFARVDARLRQMAERLERFGRSADSRPPLPAEGEEQQPAVPKPG